MRPRARPLTCALLAGGLLAGVPARAQDGGLLAQSLKKLSIEELTQIDITTASRRTEPLATAAYAVSVIRGEDIRRSGAANLAEALRLADGTVVARADNATWAISSRGFNITTANKLLVMIDGRTVYSPLYAGTMWSVQDVPLDDIDRIEVIRGPGGAIWGANAVNGVVNIITKPASDTKGGRLVAAAGTEDRAIALVQFGGSRGAADYRVYGKFRARDGQVLASGADVHDGVHYGQAGFRIESRGTSRDAWLLQGDAYGGREGLPDRPDTHVDGANVMSRWERRFSPSRALRAQIYFDHTYRRVYQQLRDTRDTIDLDVQQQFGAPRQQLIVGGNARASSGDDEGNPAFHFDPSSRLSTIAGVFAQDEIAVVPGRLALVAGAKFERNTFTGLEPQPSVRVRWTPTATRTAWAAVSRAVRLPTRFDTDLRFTNPATGAITLTGSEQFASEKVVAYEAGYRAEIASRLSLDVALFRNVYDDGRSEEFPTAPAQPVVLANLMNARTWGAELAATFAPLAYWRLHGYYGYLHEDVDFDPGSRDLTRGVNEYNDPAHTFKLRSSLDLPHAVEFDAFLRHVGRLPHPVVPAYAELGLRVGWRVSAPWEFSLIGTNLLHAHHPEFLPSTPTREEFQRGVALRAQWRF
jgi:iron complex outermembrane receptor protein